MGWLEIGAAASGAILHMDRTPKDFFDAWRTMGMVSFLSLPEQKQRHFKSIAGERRTPCFSWLAVFDSGFQAEELQALQAHLQFLLPTEKKAPTPLRPLELMAISSG